MSQNSHYFIAVPLHDELKAWLGMLQNSLQQEDSISYKTWTYPDDLHITLKFLGSVAEDNLNQLLSNLDTNLDVDPFQLTVGGLGTFGNPNKPRVLWTGVNKSEELHKLYREIETKSVEAGFNPETRPYRPHITLAKKWNGFTVEGHVMERIFTNFQESKVINISRFVVYQIFPSEKPKYHIIKEIKISS